MVEIGRRSQNAFIKLVTIWCLFGIRVSVVEAGGFSDDLESPSDWARQRVQRLLEAKVPIERGEVIVVRDPEVDFK